MSKISYDALEIDGIKEVFIQISESCKELEIDFFIVGAIARNIWFVSNDKLSEGTKDIDFGVYISDEKQYNQLLELLIEKFDYAKSKENPFCLKTKDGKQIDLLPFGEIEKDGEVMIEGKGMTSLKLDGFKEAFELGIVETTIGEEIYKTCSIPAIMILKLIAYDDRPDQRTKDVNDINSICNYYPDIETDYIWENHNDLYGNENLQQKDIGIIVLGREMKILTKENKKLETRLTKIMNDAINETSPILSLMIQDSEIETIESKREMIKHLKEGFIKDT